MRKTVLALVCILAVAAGLAGQESAQTRLDRGVDAFGAARYREALDIFGALLAEPGAVAVRPDALYWTALSAVAMADYPTAERSIQSFIASWPSDARVADLLYQRGRILYSRGDYAASLTSFSTFMSSAPTHELYSSALYWSGECLYALGRLDDARRAFSAVIERFPASVKAEAAGNKRDLIDLAFREEELLRLLTWSHEEALRAIEDFRRKEKAYEQAIAVYQKELGDMKRGAATDADKVIADLRASVADLTARLGTASADLASARSALDAARSSAQKSQEEAVAQALAKAKADAEAAAALAAQQAAPGAAVPVVTTVAGSDAAAQGAALAEVLAAKARALDLLAFYLTKLSGGIAQ